MTLQSSPFDSPIFTQKRSKNPMSSYSFYEMKKKPDEFASSSITSTSNSDYTGWEEHFSGKEYVGYYDTNYWAKLEERYGENVQFAILKAMTLTGVRVYQWKEVFSAIYKETSPFEKFSSDIASRHTNANWLLLTVARKIAQNRSWHNQYPCVDPVWLYQFGYQQPQYLRDLAAFWDDIHAEYAKPWGNTYIGQDSPEVARIKKVAREGRREIDVTAKHYRHTQR